MNTLKPFALAALASLTACATVAPAVARTPLAPPTPPTGTVDVAPAYAVDGGDVVGAGEFETTNYGSLAYWMVNAQDGYNRRAQAIGFFDTSLADVTASNLNAGVFDGDFTMPLGSVEATYTANDGFRGIYTLNGFAGAVTADVHIEAHFSRFEWDGRDLWADGSVYIDIGPNGFDLDGLHVDGIRLSAWNLDGQTGEFEANCRSYCAGFGEVKGGNATLKGDFSSDGTDFSAPTVVAGEVTVDGIYTGSQFDWFGQDNSSYRNRGNNTITGVFVAELDD